MAKNKDLQTMTNEDSTDCAWCPQEGEPQEGQSHGVCLGHATIMRMQRQVNRVPPAIDEDAADRRSHSLFQR